MALGNHALAVHGRDDARAEPLGEPRRERGRAARSAAEHEPRALRARERRRGPLDRLLVDGRRGGRRHTASRVGVADRLEHVDGHLDVHGPRPARPEVLERVADGGRGLGGRAGAPAPRDERVHRRSLALALVQEAGVATLHAGRHRRRHDQDRHRVGVRGRGRRRGVHQARAARREHDPGAAGDARVAVGRVAAALLMAGRHVPDAARGQVPVDRQRVRARDAEDQIDAAGTQGAGHGLAAGHRLADHLDRHLKHLPRAAPSARSSRGTRSRRATP